MHELGIVHRDLKPQNVLITKGMTLSAKLSDMGISKRLSKDKSSLGHIATGKFLYLSLFDPYIVGFVTLSAIKRLIGKQN